MECLADYDRISVEKVEKSTLTDVISKNSQNWLSRPRIRHQASSLCANTRKLGERRGAHLQWLDSISLVIQAKRGHFEHCMN